MEGVIYDYVRHGTTTMFAALDVATGEVITQCKPRHHLQEFRSFLRQIDDSVPDDLDIHIIVDIDCTHKHAKVKDWLAKDPVSMSTSPQHIPHGLTRLSVCLESSQRKQ